MTPEVDPLHDAALPILMLRARAMLSRRYRAAMRLHDLSEQQFRILRALQIEDFTDVRALAERTDLLGSSLSRILRDLATRGLVVRMAARDDARRTLAILTPQGRALVTDTMIDVVRINGEIEGELGVDRMAGLRRMLLELIDVLGPGGDAAEDAEPD